jgi:FKBP-type peptidyl-prolyl cis-trans isomerase FkpA
MTDDQKLVYAIGLLMQRSLNQFDLSAAELDVLKRALTDAAAGKPAIDIDEWGPKIEGFADARAERVVAREKAASVAFLAKGAAEPGAVRTASGLIYRELSAGTGAAPTADAAVRVHYRGTLINGTEFDSSYKRNEPAQFPLGGVIPCWTEGVQKMKVGGKARLLCPSDLAYGDAGRPSIPGGATLVFEIELLEIVAAPQ